MQETPEYRRGKAILAHGDILVKYAPVMVAAILLPYCCILEFEDALRLPFMDTIFATSVYTFIVYLSASYAFGYCTLHRLFIIYNFLMSCCLDYQTKEGYDFGTWLKPLHIIMTVFGIYLFLALIYKKGKLSCK